MYTRHTGDLTVCAEEIGKVTFSLVLRRLWNEATVSIKRCVPKNGSAVDRYFALDPKTSWKMTFSSDRKRLQCQLELNTERSESVIHLPWYSSNAAAVPIPSSAWFSGLVLVSKVKYIRNKDAYSGFYILFAVLGPCAQPGADKKRFCIIKFENSYSFREIDSVEI